ncbi:M20/M25/M40 family metallo-hydrolase [Rhodococcus sp. BP-252]|uniref:M20/M25/M40 family metallo-hydrolase n=1 Tax=unclassified Rhodococcus (in: high G+C Gram-positive bacteria) TaxID=192944 RepID=UPI001C9BA74C|nr:MULTISPECIES: M20/M25/M40 family metallo-hydrolase [unclassified Rhodococcus (in: high G+C Gram-positive bacteria)]MBY6411541.1 M20/M25/M40 family metallo-hydrolase [Rhodococcus sp. BP-320]MBY6417923.1 M20/M25/M40 family metallo-hydrolase [Rhodococcus sp. BP-321]MBY6422176.1 M20/M25/M40 family metallo-hydrolase [Rhodococcus sp. BP-324]MBY6427721.1 M20/M25/M40 family metallo-hydrolase [Rhodococcus sp. BP-323]MBY6433060.1 M20/M25/M40 family metallo-hydrolase [Rhodococcus sp. BP-322]
MDSTGLLQELVARRTVSGDPDPQRLTMETVVSVVKSKVGTVDVQGEPDGAHPWLLLTNDAPPSATRLVFACHVDTVPPGDLVHWEFDPFAASVENGLLHGRGTSDMKAGLVAATAAVIDAAERGIPIALLLTSDEEIGSLGAQAARHAVADCSVGAVIVPEATGNGVHLGHRGALWLDVATKGVAAHGSTPQKGESAIMKLVDVLARARTELPLAEDPFLGAETFNVGTIGGGSAPNIVPDAAQVIVDHRTVGTGENLLAWWRSQPEVHSVEARIDLPGVRTPSGDPWVRSLATAVADGPVTYFTDASILAATAPSAPIVVWGPGTPALMHAANESVSLAEVDAAARAYTAVARAWPTVD